jgi:cytochrome P450
MQQQPRSGSQEFALFRSHDLTEIPQTYAWFEQMRNNQPVSLEERMEIWQVFRYEDVLKVITDYARFSSQAFGISGSFLKDTLVAKDPPDHRKLRNLVNQAFTPRAVARLSDRITQITQELLDVVRDQGRMDVVSDIAFPLPAKVIAELLGVPSEDWNIFQRWARIDSSSPPQQANERSMQEEMASYFSALLKERRRTPREDLIISLMLSDVDFDRVFLCYVVCFCFLMVVGGQFSSL